MHNGEATYRKRLEYAETDCTLLFKFKGDTLTVVEAENDCQCGFGHNVYLDDTFLRATSEIPLHYTTISNDKVYFSQWKEDEQSDERSYPKINSRFTDYFPDLTLGQEHERGQLIPSEIAEEFLTDLLNTENEANQKFYAVGKITGYRGMDLFIYDIEEELKDEDTYDNHMDGLRYVLFYQQDGSPCLTFDSEYEDQGLIRATYCLASHYYGEGGEASFRSYFDTDTTLISHRHISESESATGFQTPRVSDEEFRWNITLSDTEGLKREVLEITKLEFSSPFYDRNYLLQQDWNTVEDKGFNGRYPTKTNKWWLDIDEYRRADISFYIERIDGELFPIFETTGDDRVVIDRYIVGKPHDTPNTDTNYDTPETLKCPVIIKTSDGDLKFLPGQRVLSE
ncbi:MAG: hypothetical protein LUE99_06665 [Bacteroides sp.]|nr:hypothetical protein [Bacteroides sp.]